MSPSVDTRENREFAAEIKFLVPPGVGEEIRRWARLHLAQDPHADPSLDDAYRITSLYFDTRDFDVFHRRGSFGRSKYRIRRYGPNPLVFLERKLKTHGMVAKRRATVDFAELVNLTTAEPSPGWKGAWYQRRLLARRMSPVCQISYCRTARVSMTAHGPIRLTVDRGVRALPAEGLVFRGTEDGARVSAHHDIVELKFRSETPLLFKRLVEEFSLTPHPVSKYRLAVAALGLAVAGSSPGSAAPLAVATYA